ncbi:MAG: Isochorismatase hydrolase [Candidatus Nomurabacteria bacterium GW2011_GWB1_37_5]|uniref:Isochorismatase hydrolase n=1 Tax=Candidatus Nomurabacteria bacterium GW2011_GWB1_37_5 TaxID=1618742 RepID=A0A0G0H9G6_9BACT|nr:MAG: Isochorismatase hydrolase [Candidatus Nomurabacteria bacterium GW2011_GWB1_37_5]
MKKVFTGYDPKNAANFLYNPDMGKVQEEALAYAKANKLTPGGADRKKIALLLIDVQRDFCHLEGTLYVGGRSGQGSIDDSRRIAEFIYKNVGVISQTISTLDTHFPWQIFFSSFFVNQKGEELKPHTLVDVMNENGREFLANLDLGGNVIAKDIAPNPKIAKDLKVNPAWLQNQCIHYCKELKNPASGRNKYTLYLWPLHCLIGSIGHTIVGVVDEARQFHAFARSAQPLVEIKGGNPLTENYSIVQPEVLSRFDSPSINLAERNVKFLQHLLDHDAVIIAGQASSHCVASSIDDILSEINAKDPSLAKKVYILSDCTSAVAVPDGKGNFVADFTPQAEAAFKRFSDAGMNLVKSTDPISSWPGLASL